MHPRYSVLLENETQFCFVFILYMYVYNEVLLDSADSFGEKMLKS